MKIMFEGKYYTCTPSTSEKVGDHISVAKDYHMGFLYFIFFFFGGFMGAILASIILQCHP